PPPSPSTTLFRSTLAEELVVERADLDVALFVAEREVEREILVLFLARARLHAQRVEDPVARIREIDRRPDFGDAAAYGDVDVARGGRKQVSGHAPAGVRFGASLLALELEIDGELASASG